jgi:hypothetical protein
MRVTRMKRFGQEILQLLRSGLLWATPSGGSSSMANVDGEWECTVKSPMGDQDFVLSVQSEGDTFVGKASGALGSMAIPEGMVDGDTLKWSMSIKAPFPTSVRCEAIVVGDRIDGTVTAGIFGSFPVAGVRLPA